jgi:hypothetical protein
MGPQDATNDAGQSVRRSLGRVGAGGRGRLGTRAPAAAQRSAAGRHPGATPDPRRLRGPSPAPAALPGHTLTRAHRVGTLNDPQRPRSRPQRPHTPHPRAGQEGQARLGSGSRAMARAALLLIALAAAAAVPAAGSGADLAVEHGQRHLGRVLLDAHSFKRERGPGWSHQEAAGPRGGLRRGGRGRAAPRSAPCCACAATRAACGGRAAPAARERASPGSRLPPPPPAAEPLARSRGDRCAPARRCTPRAGGDPVPLWAAKTGPFSNPRQAGGPRARGAQRHTPSSGRRRWLRQPCLCISVCQHSTLLDPSRGPDPPPTPYHTTPHHTTPHHTTPPNPTHSAPPHPHPQ